MRCQIYISIIKIVCQAYLSEVQTRYLIGGKSKIRKIHGVASRTTTFNMFKGCHFYLKQSAHGICFSGRFNTHSKQLNFRSTTNDHTLNCCVDVEPSLQGYLRISQLFYVLDAFAVNSTVFFHRINNSSQPKKLYYEDAFSCFA